MRGLNQSDLAFPPNYIILLLLKYKEINLWLNAQGFPAARSVPTINGMDCLRMVGGIQAEATKQSGGVTTKSLPDFNGQLAWEAQSCQDLVLILEI